MQAPGPPPGVLIAGRAPAGIMPGGGVFAGQAKIFFRPKPLKNKGFWGMGKIFLDFLQKGG